MGGEVPRDGERVLALAGEPERQRPQAAQDQPGLERPRDGTADGAPVKQIVA